MSFVLQALTSTLRHKTDVKELWGCFMSDAGSAWLQLTGSQADLVAAASSGNLQALNSMSTGNLAGLSAGAGLTQSQVCNMPTASSLMLTPCVVLSPRSPFAFHCFY